MPRTASIGTRMVFAVVGICSLAGALSSAWLVARPDLMMVERITFSGTDQATVQQLRHLADVPNGTRVWEVDEARIQAGVERHPWVKRATVTRTSPTALSVEVFEHRPVALLHHDRVYYVAEDGTLFLPADGRDLDYPNLTGITPDLARLHPDLPRRIVQDALRLLNVLDTRGLISRAQVDEINFSRTRGFTVRTRGSRILFSLAGLDPQLDRFASLLASGMVDLDHAFHVDLGPRSVAIVRQLDVPKEG